MSRNKILFIVAPLLLILASVFLMASFFDHRTTADIIGSDAVTSGSESSEASESSKDIVSFEDNTTPNPTPTKKPGKITLPANTPKPTPTPIPEEDDDSDALVESKCRA